MTSPKENERTASPDEGGVDTPTRRETRCPLTLRAQLEMADERSTAYLMNLSSAGAFLNVEAALSIGDTVFLTCDLPGRLGRLRVEAEVRWVDAQGESPGGGVAFQNVSDEAKEKLESYCRMFLSLAEQIEKAAERKPK